MVWPTCCCLSKLLRELSSASIWEESLCSCLGGASWVPPVIQGGAGYGKSTRPEMPRGEEGAPEIQA